MADRNVTGMTAQADEREYNRENEREGERKDEAGAWRENVRKRPFGLSPDALDFMLGQLPNRTVVDSVPQASMTPRRAKVRRLVGSRLFSLFITAIVLLNAVTLGVETTSPSGASLLVLHVIDWACMVVYVTEAVLKIYAYRGAYFRDGWNVFDFTITVLALIPTEIIPVPVQVARVLRLFRVFRIFRIVSAFQQLRVITEAVFKSIPGVLWTTLLMGVISYIYAIAGVSVFSEEFPQYFGDLWRSFFTLFELMTLEGWNGIAEDVMRVYPWAWVYFVTFVIISAFILMNVVVGVIVNSIDESQNSIDAVLDEVDGTDEGQFEAGLDELERQMDVMRRMIADRKRAMAREALRERLGDDASSVSSGT